MLPQFLFVPACFFLSPMSPSPAPFHILVLPSLFFAGILLSRKPQETWGNVRLSKTTMVGKNGRVALLQLSHGMINPVLASLAQHAALGLVFLPFRNPGKSAKWVGVKMNHHKQSKTTHRKKEEETTPCFSHGFHLPVQAILGTHF